MSATKSAVRSVLVFAIVIGIIAAAIWWGLGTAKRKGMLGPIVVPTEYRAPLEDAAARCPAIPVNVLAAQIYAESGFDANAQSHAGAQGIAQFMPSVWHQYGLDANGDGKADVWDPTDAIATAARMDCLNRRLVRHVPGNRLRNTLAAYNAGFGAVLHYNGVPPFPETQNYVDRVLQISQSIKLS